MILLCFSSDAQVCRERVSSLFLPAGPLHMLPPAALNALTLSADPGAANEVLTVALSVHPDTGRSVPVQGGVRGG